MEELMEKLREYETKLLLAIAAIAAFAASTMDYIYPTAASIIKLAGWALLVWAIVEPKQEEE